MKDDLVTLRKWHDLGVPNKVKIWKALLGAQLTNPEIVFTDKIKRLNDLKEKIDEMEQPNNDIKALNAGFLANLKEIFN